MATTTHIEEKPRIIVPRASRGNEILAILFIALGLLLALCLISAAFYPNDPSWNSAGQSQTQNWAGSIGANVAATGFQFIGLAAYLLPLLLFAAAWRRFRTEHRLQVVDANRWDRGACDRGGSAALDLTHASVVRRQCAAWWSAGRGGRAGTREWSEQHRRDDSARGNRSKRPATRDKLLVRSTLRDPRACDRFEVRFCRKTS